MRIGIVNNSNLADILARRGYDVVTGRNFIEGAKAVRGADLNGMPVIVFDSASTHSAAPQWLRVAEKTHPIAVVALDNGHGIASAQSRQYTAPVQFGDLVLELTDEWVDDFELTIMPDGSVVEPDAPEATEDEAFGTFDDNAPTPVSTQQAPDPWEDAVPAIVDSAPVAVAPPDPWEDTPAPVTRPEPVAQPAPAPVTRPEPVAQPAPAPVTRPEPVAQPAPSRHVEVDDDMFDDLIDAALPQADHRMLRGRGALVFSTAGKGGVGKTTLSLHLAQLAATRGPDGFRVILIDANRGQGDVVIYLRLKRSGLPTMYDAAVRNNPKLALSSPQQIAQFRRPEWGPIDFAVMLAPPKGLSSPDEVPDSAYRDAIEWAREEADLVVVDTQISEDTDLSGIFDGLVIPMAARDAHILAITDDTSAGKHHLIARSEHFISQGVPRDRISIVFNDIPENAVEGNTQTFPRLAQIGVPVGAIPSDPELEAAMKRGKLVTDHEDLNRVLLAVLHRVTKRPEFLPEAEETKRGLFGRVFGRKKR